MLGLDYERLHKLENATFTPTFWRWYRHVMLDIYENLFNGIKSIPDGRESVSIFFTHEFICRPVPPMIYDKIISEYIKTAKFRQIEEQEENPNEIEEKPHISKLKTF